MRNKTFCENRSFFDQKKTFYENRFFFDKKKGIPKNTNINLNKNILAEEKSVTL